MRVISSVKKGGTVKEALKKTADQINEKLSDIPGSIAGIKSSIDVGISGTKVQLVATVDEKHIRSKKIFWVNEGATSEEKALNQAEERINKKIEKISGEIADFHLKPISPPLPKRIYVTMIVGVNEKVPEEIGSLTTEERRARLSEILSLLGNKANAINISKTAEIFNVSRDVIYRDLEKMDFER